MLMRRRQACLNVTQLFAQFMFRRQLLSLCCAKTVAAGGMSICLSSSANQALVHSSHHVKAPTLQLACFPQFMTITLFLQPHGLPVPGCHLGRLPSFHDMPTTWLAFPSFRDTLMTPVLLLQLCGGPVCLSS